MPTDALVLPVAQLDNSIARIATQTFKNKTFPWGTHKVQMILSPLSRLSTMITIFVKTHGLDSHRDTFSLIGE